jgi:hypothetical protein
MCSRLLYVIDATGSMGSWITALNSLLPSVIRSIAMTGIFSEIGIAVYRDYDSSGTTLYDFSEFCNCNDQVAIAKLVNFARFIAPIGGGGAPEAVKTAILKLRDIPQVDGEKYYLIHLTDAPPHEISRLDTQGAMEMKALERIVRNRDWTNIVDLFLLKHPNTRYMCLTTCVHQFYCYFAQKTQGDVFKLSGSSSIETIRSNLTQIFNALLKFDNPVVDRWEIPFTQNDNINSEGQLMKWQPVKSLVATAECRILMTNMSNAMERLKRDEGFLEFVIEEFRSIISDDVMALTMSPIIGKMWRELCKRRSDPRRDELIELLSKKKNLLGLSEKSVIEAWLKESYNAKSEIDAELKEFISKTPVEGLLRFTPEREGFFAQQIVQLLAAGDKKSTTVIRSLLCRLYVDNTYRLDQQVVDDDTDVPIPSSSIPLNLNIYKFFELVMHTIAPGTKLTRRYSGMLSCHILACGSVLAPQAKVYLEKIKGKWINWKRRDDGTPEVPESWSRTFLDLILHESCSPYMTEEELTNARFYRKVASLLSFYHNIETTVKLVDSTSVDTKYPDHMVRCTNCNFRRPLSIIAADGMCGYCKPYIEYEASTFMDKNKKYYADEMQITNPYGKIVTARPEKMSYVQVRCYPCGSIYSRDSTVSIPGYSKCFGCRFGTTPSPCAKCTDCGLNFVSWSNSLPNGKCAGCSAGLDKRVLQYREYPVLIQQVLSNNFTQLCETLGYTVGSAFKPNCALYDAITQIKECEPVISPIPTNITFRESTVCNVEDIWTYALGVMSGTTKVKLPECSVCMDTYPSSELVRACGRRGCEQRVCNTCAAGWYGLNKVGTTIYQRATMCQFCSRVPTPAIIGRIDVKLMDLATAVAKNQLDPDAYYGWCTLCYKPHEVARRECAGVAPILANYKCYPCVTGNLPTILTKDCPYCEVTTEKTGGCNHITCGNCDNHWCWVCEAKCSSAEQTYRHLNKEHGGIFDGENYYSDDEDY